MIDFPPTTSQVKKNNGTLFPGLRSFRESEAHLYYGRESYINELKLKLTNSRFITVIGSAESGKSSLIHAGLIPELKNKFSINGQDEWIYTHFIPRMDPISDLAHALVWVDDKPDLSAKDSFKQEMLDILNEGGSTGILKAYEKLLGNQERNPNLLIVLDQFDSFFDFYHKQKHDGRAELAAKNLSVNSLSLPRIQSIPFISF